MAVSEMEKLILKYLSNNATSQELDMLSNWILDKDNEKVFGEMVQLHLEINTTMNDPDTKKIKRQLLQKIKKDKIRRNLKGIMKYAAVGGLFLVLGYFYQQRATETDGPILVPKEEPITITLADGTTETLALSDSKKVRDAKGKIIGVQDRSKLVYKGAAAAKKLVYNSINVPYGKRFDVVLSDGTHIFLNSGSSLRYPVSFIKDAARTVFLTGEAYFDVAKDEKRPFIVNTKEMDIEVLGTKFNVSHYPEDTNISTVLVEGSVELQKKRDSLSNRAVLLKSGFKAEWHKNTDEISIKNVDTSLYTAWMEGKLVFRNTSFRQIRQALERHYNITIINGNSSLDEQLFDATFDIETIDQVLESFSKSYAIEYTVVDNQVIIQ